MTTKMKFKLISLTVFIWGSISVLEAQVGVNTSSPHASSALDVVSPGNNQGVLLPRMTTTQKTSIVSPAGGLIVYDTDKRCLSQNVGTSTVPVWICLEQVQNRFFYMPSVAVNASALGTNKNLDLYLAYKTQFNTPMSSSAGAPVSIPYFTNATDLNYYVTSFDNTVLKINSISNAGVVNYDIIKVADYASFMNVVFVIK